MLYEIAYLQDGALVRGGIATTLGTVSKWIKKYSVEDPDTTYVAVPADENAITLDEHRRNCVCSL